MKNEKRKQRASPHSNKINLPFEEAIRRALQTKPKKRQKPEPKPTS